MDPAEYAARAEEFEQQAATALALGDVTRAELLLMCADELHEDADRAETEAAA